MRFLTFSLLLLACGPAHRAVACIGDMCTTECGLTLKGSFETGKQRPDFDIGMLVRLEQLAIEYGLGACADFEGYSVWVREDNWDLYRDGNWRAGSTYCNLLAPRIEFTARYPEVVLHELHHVQQRCVATPPLDPGVDASHADWVRSGVYKKIEAASEDFKLFMKSRGGP